MESKDDDVVRFSDLIKKGVVKKDTSETEETTDDARRSDDAPLRFSELDALKLKSRLITRDPSLSKESPIRPERKMTGEGKAAVPREGDLNDFEEYKKLKAEELQKPPLTAAIPGRDAGPVRKDEKIRSSEMVMPIRKAPRDTTDLKEVDAVFSRKEEKREPEKLTATAITGQEADVKIIYDEAIYCLELIKEKVIAGQPFDLQQARKIIEKMIESRERIEGLYPLTTKIIKEKDYNVSHQTNVAIYAIKLGFGLGYSWAKLLDLGLCSLLHDAGMFKIPESIRLKREKLTGQEVDIIKTHPDMGNDILSAYKGSHPNLSIVAYEHHEREGGQGYPRGLKGNDIHEFARIVAITDSYESMTHHRPYRKALLQNFSAKELIKQKNALFAPFVIKVFLQEISLYPPGSYVILNNKAIAEVVVNDKNHPLRPDVRIIYDAEGNKIHDDIIIKLAQNPLFFIVDGVLQEEISIGKHNK
jgi:HD-GYP domain-containing protein (c-di-GMP phosphodiesterase class II)